MGFLETFYKITLYLLPFFAICLLIFLIVLVVKLFRSLKTLNEVLDKTKVTVDHINNSLVEIQKPLTTLAKISAGIDVVYDYSEQAIRNFVIKILDLVNMVKVWIDQMMNKSSKESVGSEDEQESE